MDLPSQPSADYVWMTSSFHGGSDNSITTKQAFSACDGDAKSHSGGEYSPYPRPGGNQADSEPQPAAQLFGGMLGRRHCPLYKILESYSSNCASEISSGGRYEISISFVDHVVLRAGNRVLRGTAAAQARQRAFLWAKAKQNYRMGDLLKTDSILLDLRGTANMYAARRAIMATHRVGSCDSGLFRKLADAYESGGRHDTANPLRFRNQADKLRSFAATAALEFAQAVHEITGSEPASSC